MPIISNNLIRSTRLLLALFVVLLLAACAGAPDTVGRQTDQGEGANTPEDAVEGFFEDLRTALNDPELRREEVRSSWAEQLARYFTPYERDDQRGVLRSALANFVGGLDALGPDESLMIEIRFERVLKMTDDGERALVNIQKGEIYLLIRGPSSDYEQKVAIETILGRPDGTVPTIKIGNRWFLTEG